MGIRAFFAIDLSEQILGALDAAGESFRAADPRWAGEKWVRRSQLHVTITFMPSVPPDAVEGLLADASEVVSRSSGVALQPGVVVAKPNAMRARMLWASFRDESRAVLHLAEAVESVAHRYRDTGAPTRRFHPHATLCRARRPAAVDPEALRCANQAFLQHASSMSVSQVTLYSSVLERTGPVYDVLGYMPLGSV